MSIALLSVAFLLAISSLMIKKSVSSIISFILMMFVLGLYYISLDAKLLGLFQIFVYTGGIMVLMLFGVTIIGVTYPESKIRPYSAFASFLVFIALNVLFFNSLDTLNMLSNANIEDVSLFASNFSDFVIIFALIGTSLLYATVKMSSVLKAKKRGKDV
jgi:NADH-quinone oxidoreductase subunit J